MHCQDNQHLCQGGINNEGCPLPDICIQRSNTCPVVCPVHCLQDEIKCSRPDNAVGCPMPDDCHPRRNGNCTNWCPMFCGPEEKLCPGGEEPDGCPCPPTCHPKKKEDGCDYHCIPHCGEGQHLCPGQVDEDNCNGPPMCLEQVEGCPTYCPGPTCTEETYPCPGEGVDGCPTASVCIPKVAGCENICPITCPQGQKLCIDASATCPYVTQTCIPETDQNGCSNHCPPGDCPKGKKLCPEPGLDNNHCPNPPTCLDDNCDCPDTCPDNTTFCVNPFWNGTSCYFQTICIPEKHEKCRFPCPTLCEGTMCLSHPKEEDNCPPDEFTCLPMTNEDECQACPESNCPPGTKLCGGINPVSGCPITFCSLPAVDGCDPVCETVECDSDNGLLCSSPPNENNCPQEPICLEKTNEDGCPNYCPPGCNNDEIKCTSNHLTNGCPGPDYCMQRQGNDGCENFCWPCGQNETACIHSGSNCSRPEDIECFPSPPEECPLVCPPLCPPNSIRCPGPTLPNGCPGPYTCMPEASGTCPNYCHLHDCSASLDHQICPGLKDDSTGCQEEPTCFPLKDDEGCDVHCPMDCGPEHKACPGTIDPITNCRSPFDCFPEKDSTGCPNICPNICELNEKRCQGLLNDDGCRPGLCIAAKDENECPKLCPEELDPECSSNLCSVYLSS